MKVPGNRYALKEKEIPVEKGKYEED